VVLGRLPLDDSSNRRGRSAAHSVGGVGEASLTNMKIALSVVKLGCGRVVGKNGAE
jgi:hypothetical protein